MNMIIVTTFTLKSEVSLLMSEESRNHSIKEKSTSAILKNF